MGKLQAYLLAGGSDGAYAMKPTAETPNFVGFASLQKYKIGVDFIGQAWHTTPVMHYNDTLNFVIYPTATGIATVIISIL